MMRKSNFPLWRIPLSVVLLAGLCLLLNGCATLTLWSKDLEKGEENYQGQRAVVSEDQQCVSIDLRRSFSFDKLTVSGTISPEDLRHIRTVFRDPALFSPLSTTMKIPAMKAPATGRFKISNDFPAGMPGVILVNFDSVPAIPGVGAHPSMKSQLLSDLIAERAWREKSGTGVPLFWIDRYGQIIEDASVFEENDCSEAVLQGAVLMIAVANQNYRSKAVIARVGAEVVCRYNCNTLQSCTDYDEVGSFRSIELSDFRVETGVHAGSDHHCGGDRQHLPQGFADSFRLTMVRHGEPRNFLKGARIVATPVAVAFDIVTFPFQLFTGIFYQTYFDLIWPQNP